MGGFNEDFIERPTHAARSNNVFQSLLKNTPTPQTLYFSVIHRF